MTKSKKKLEFHFPSEFFKANHGRAAEYLEKEAPDYVVRVVMELTATLTALTEAFKVARSQSFRLGVIVAVTAQLIAFGIWFGLR